MASAGVGLDRALRADLQAFSRAFHGLDHQPAFANVVAARLLHVDVLAGVECQDGGRAVPVVGRGNEDASTRGSSKTSRMSPTALGAVDVLLSTCLAAVASRSLSTSQTYATSTSFRSHKRWRWLLPMPPGPITATTSLSSAAARAAAGASVAMAAAAPADCRNVLLYCGHGGAT